MPQSWVFSGEAFQWFVAHLLARLPEFRAVYNEAIRQYRRQCHVRSRSHPVPELAQQAPWLEAPFWVFSAERAAAAASVCPAPRRRDPPFRPADWQAALPLPPEGDAARAVERLMELHRRGVRIRSRALITTLWARLALGDLFIHGIGGAKYDAVTDVLIERFFGLPPPGFLVVSATLHLPIPRPAGKRGRSAGRPATNCGQMTYHPERFLGGADGLEGGRTGGRQAALDRDAGGRRKRPAAVPRHPPDQCRVAAAARGSPASAPRARRSFRAGWPPSRSWPRATTPIACIRNRRSGSFW